MKKRSSLKRKIIAITTGDSDGIGLEVTMKALAHWTNSQSTFLIFRNPKVKKKSWKDLPKKKCLLVKDLGSALTEAHTSSSPYRFIEVLSDESPSLWVQECAQLCLRKEIDGLTTGPVSKKTFIDAGLDSIGHTPLLKKVAGVPETYMGFLGASFNVILLSGHIPLAHVEKQLTPSHLKLALDTIAQWRKTLPSGYQKKACGVLGLNPHNGEEGLIGNFENHILHPLLQNYPAFQGPLVPDVAFFKESWKKYSFFIALYHDQGLIPFKMIHGRTGGCHVSVGLPFVRTSVDHGTAKDIFGKNLARPDSMRAALKWCEALIPKKGR